MKRLANKIQRVGVLGNSGKAACAGVVRQAAQWVKAAGRELYFESVTARWAGLQRVTSCDLPALARQVDLLLVFGGDGTILRVAREIAGSQTPILGINIGSLGFLTAVPSSELRHALDAVWSGQYTFECRSLLQAKGRCGGQSIDYPALNDIVFSRGAASRLIELEVRVDGEPLTRYRCDGLIVSSPTGSTAYSMAAGGAVVFPTAEVLALTPICPHTLSNRPLILPMTARIEVRVVSQTAPALLSADGQVLGELAAEDPIIVRRSRRSVRLMHLAGSSFCETLRRKLHWRGATL